MKRSLCLLLLSAAVVISCNKEGEIFYDDTAPEETHSEVTRSQEGGSDPFAIDAMQRALDLLSADNPSLAGVTLQPTDYYVKFNPQDSVQMNALEKSGIELFNHPLDNGIYTETEPDDVTEDSPIIYEPLYSVVPAAFCFPEGVDYEIIHDVFIQRSDRLSASEEYQLPMDLYGSVLNTSMQLTGNAPATRSADEEVELVEASARIRYVVERNDTYHISRDTLPLVGAKVRMYFHTLLGTGITDSVGKTPVMGMVNGTVGYDILWDNPKWTLYIASKNKIRTTNFGTGHNKPLDTVINTGGFDGVLAGAHTALYSYFNINYPLTTGLEKPAKRIKIATMNKYGRSNTAPVRPTREIFFYGKKYKKSTIYHQSEEAMKHMFHELGHMSHNKLNEFNYSFTAHSRYGESWATGVEYAYMKSFFPEYEYTYYRSDGDSHMYTHAVQCMLKNGFTLEDIQRGFKAADASGWDGWQKAMKENVINHWTDRSEEEKARMRQIIDLLFFHPNDLTFDVRDMIEAGSETAFMNEPVRFRLIDDARNVTGEDRFVKIEGWEFPDSDAVVVSNGGDNVLVYFRKGGMKTIRLNVAIDGVRFTSEKKLNVYGLDIIEFPEDPVVGYTTQFSLRKQLADAGVKVTRWESGDRKTVRVSSGPQIGHFLFTEEGTRSIKSTIHYPDLNETVSYENIEVKVRYPEPDETFSLIDRPDILRYNTPYKASYMPAEEKVTEITDIEFNHYSALFYYDFTEWSFDAGKGILTFSIPEFNATMDYILTIRYKVGNSAQVRTAQLFVSNYR